MRLGHLGLGEDSARELCAILGRQGIRFPNGGLEECRNEKWVVFGPFFRCESLSLETERHEPPHLTPFGLCIEIVALLNIVTDGDADCINRLKFTVNCSPCTGEGQPCRTWKRHSTDFQNGEHNVVTEPCVSWRETPMEGLALAPLHLLL